LPRSEGGQTEKAEIARLLLSPLILPINIKRRNHQLPPTKMINAAGGVMVDQPTPGN